MKIHKPGRKTAINPSANYEARMREAQSRVKAETERLAQSIQDASNAITRYNQAQASLDRLKSTGRSDA